MELDSNDIVLTLTYMVMGKLDTYDGHYSGFR